MTKDNRPTRRQQLIGQLRRALNELERPEREDDYEVVFEVGDIEFSFLCESLAELVDPDD